MQLREYDIMYELEPSYWWHSGMRSIMDGLIGKSIDPDSKLLDIGCGTGARLKMLSGRCETWGIDSHPRAVEFCRRRGLKNISVAEAADLPFPSGVFTHATCCEVLQNLDDDLVALKEAFRVLRPGGIFYVSEQAYPLLRTRHDISQGAVRRYSKSHLKSLLAAAGFGIERLTAANTVLFPLLAAYRLTSRLKNPPAKMRPEESLSDLHPLPGPVNYILRSVLEAERGVIEKTNLPFGLTLIAVARKPAT